MNTSIAITQPNVLAQQASLFNSHTGFLPVSASPSVLENLILLQVIDQYNAELESSKKHVKELHQLEVNPSLINELSIGISTGVLSKHIGHRDSDNGISMRSILKQYELLKTNGKEAFKGGFFFPTKGLDGQCNGAEIYHNQTKWQSAPFESINWSDSKLGIFNHRVIESVDDSVMGKDIIFCQHALHASQLISAGYGDVIALIIKTPDVRDFIQWIKKVPFKWRRAVLCSESSAFGEYWEQQLSQALRLLGIEQETFVNV